MRTPLHRMSVCPKCGIYYSKVAHKYSKTCSALCRELSKLPNDPLERERKGLRIDCFICHQPFSGKSLEMKATVCKSCFLAQRKARGHVPIPETLRVWLNAHPGARQTLAARLRIEKYRLEGRSIMPAWRINQIKFAIEENLLGYDGNGHEAL